MLSPSTTVARPVLRGATAASLSHKVGQMLIVGFEGQKPTDPGVLALRQKAETGTLGGVIFFAYNIVSPEQVKILLDHMASWQTPLPLLFAVDQEGGAVQRLPVDKGFAGWPSAHSFQNASEAVAQASFTGLARELSALGFNFNFAPCVDLHDPASPGIGARGRSFGHTSQDVQRLARLQLAAQARAGVYSAIKHFPGHGFATGDTHAGLTDITDSFKEDELAAFAELVASEQVDAVMTSHLVHRGLDPDAWPVTFSPSIIQGLLRGRLGFGGVVVTDDLGMGALVQHYDFATIVQRALLSGHDMLIFGQNGAASGGPLAHVPLVGLHASAVRAVQEGMRVGTMSQAGLDASYRRIVKLKTGQTLRDV